MPFYDVETILDEALDLTAGGPTADHVDTGEGPDYPGQNPTSPISAGSSEGHLSYARLTVTEEAVGAGADCRLVIEDSADGSTWFERASVTLGLDRFVKGATTKCRIPPKISRYIRCSFDPGAAPPTGGVGVVDLFHG